MQPEWCEPDRPPVIMGILNVTPDSFSDGGRFQLVDQAVTHARAMLGAGAGILDIGGESTRPGAVRQGADTQVARVVPVIRAIRERLGDAPVISIDTTRSEVAEAAIEAGANMINDVSAGRDSSDMFMLAARTQVPIALMHMQGEPKTMQDDPRYADVLGEVGAFLSAQAAQALNAGVPARNIVLDPGIGFGKRRRDNLDLLAGLQQLVASGYPVLLGTSRKRFMGHLCSEKDPVELLGATCATTALGVAAGVRIFRVHDVRENRQAADVAWALRVTALPAGPTGD